MGDITKKIVLLVADQDTFEGATKFSSKFGNPYLHLGVFRVQDLPDDKDKAGAILKNKKGNPYSPYYQPETEMSNYLNSGKVLATRMLEDGRGVEEIINAITQEFGGLKGVMMISLNLSLDYSEWAEVAFDYKLKSEIVKKYFGKKLII
jgi:hypothetical protein